MRIGVTGGTGFLGRYIVNHLLRDGHQLSCWHRPASDRGGFNDDGGSIQWIEGRLTDDRSNTDLVQGVDAVVHSALEHPDWSFRPSAGEFLPFVEANVMGTLKLVQAARTAGVKRFIFISSCAVHDVILPDRPLDETHPMWASHYYGAHKAAIEEFIYSFGLGEKYDICALRPTGIYGVARPVQNSRWFDVVQRVKRGEPVSSSKGGKEVHAADVAKAVGILLTAPGIAGQAYNCYDMYVSEEEVARITKQLTNSASTISDTNRGPRNQIVSDKLMALGMKFGGRPLLEQTVADLVRSL